MKYGKWFRVEVERTFPEWRGQFISYKQLKKQLKLFKHIKQSGFTSRGFSDVNATRRSIRFTRLLDEELDKINAFYFDKEEDYIIRIKELQIRVGKIESEEGKVDLQNDLLEFHAEMVLLLHYSVLNFTGLRKIVKKHNKRTGTSLHFFSIPTTGMQQTFFSTDLLYKLMTDCEAMLSCLSRNGEP